MTHISMTDDVKGYEFRIKRVADDDRFGNCERCGKKCVPHYVQQYRKKDGINKGWIVCGFGHVDCLRNLHWGNASVVD